MDVERPVALRASALARRLARRERPPNRLDVEAEPTGDLLPGPLVDEVHLANFGPLGHADQLRPSLDGPASREPRGAARSRRRANPWNPPEGVPFHVAATNGAPRSPQRPPGRPRGGVGRYCVPRIATPRADSIPYSSCASPPRTLRVGAAPPSRGVSWPSSSYSIDRTFPFPPDAPLSRVHRSRPISRRGCGAAQAKDVRARADARVGGAVEVTTAGTTPDDPRLGYRGVFADVVPGRRLVYTVHWDADVGYNAPGMNPVDEVMVVEISPDAAGSRLRALAPRHPRRPWVGRGARALGRARRSTTSRRTSRDTRGVARRPRAASGRASIEARNSTPSSS